jgi:hypothetical protein
MKIIQDDLWLCVDCLFYAVNGDLTGIDDAKRAKEVSDGVDALGPHLVPDFDVETGEGRCEFARMGCDACGSHLAGEMHRFAILGEE